MTFPELLAALEENQAVLGLAFGGNAAALYPGVRPFVGAELEALRRHADDLCLWLRMRSARN